MVFGKQHSPQVYDRRSRQRIALAVPVHLGRAAIGEVEGVAAATGETANLSTGGVYLITDAVGPFEPGDMLRISIEIPQESRRAFPFSRITGPCQVVRTQQFPSADPDARWGLALEFCQDRITMLGAIVSR